jgi:hypothetical protein
MDLAVGEPRRAVTIDMVRRPLSPSGRVLFTTQFLGSAQFWTLVPGRPAR